MPFNHVGFVARGQQNARNAMLLEEIERVLEDRPSTNWKHRFGRVSHQTAQSGPEASTNDDCLSHHVLQYALTSAAPTSTHTPFPIRLTASTIRARAPLRVRRPVTPRNGP